MRDAFRPQEVAVIAPALVFVVITTHYAASFNLSLDNRLR